MTVKRLRHEIDCDEMAHWMAYDSISPIGDGHSDILAAMICQTVGNRTGGKDGNPFKLSEYFPDFWGDRSEEDNYPTTDELLEKTRAIHAIISALNAAKETQNG